MNRSVNGVATTDATPSKATTLTDVLVPLVVSKTNRQFLMTLPKTSNGYTSNITRGNHRRIERVMEEYGEIMEEYGTTRCAEDEARSE